MSVTVSVVVTVPTSPLILFTMINHTGRCRAIRQDSDSIERIQEAIDTCPVDCIH